MCEFDSHRLIDLSDDSPDFEQIAAASPPHRGHSLLVVDAAHHRVVLAEAVGGHGGALEEGQDDEAGDPEGRHDVVPLRQGDRALCVRYGKTRVW